MIKFNLDIITDANLDEHIVKAIDSCGGQFLGCESIGNAFVLSIGADNLEIANKIVDELYGEDDGSRETNEFYINGK